MYSDPVGRILPSHPPVVVDWLGSGRLTATPPRHILSRTRIARRASPPDQVEHGIDKRGDSARDQPGPKEVNSLLELSEPRLG